MRLRALSLSLLILLSGCGSLLPEAKTITRSPWATFEDAKRAYDSIEPYKSTIDDLKRLGYDPFVTPNIKILSYLDVMNRFMINPSIKKEDLDEGIQRCIDFKNYCKAFEATPQDLKTKRYGNVFLDLFNFSRRTKSSGWRFQAIIVLVDDVVVYKLWSGNPTIDEFTEKKNPLGPLQEPEDVVKEAVKGLY